MCYVLLLQSLEVTLLWHFQCRVPALPWVPVQQRARGDADGFQMKWMLQQTCQCGKDDVWERIRAHGYTRAALRQVILCWNGENKIKGNENIYGVV